MSDDRSDSHINSKYICSPAPFKEVPKIVVRVKSRGKIIRLNKKLRKDK